MSDLDAALAWAAHNKGDASRMGEIGFCRGGRNVWLYATHNPDLKAAVAFYGVLGVTAATLSRTPRLMLPIRSSARSPGFTAARTRSSRLTRFTRSRTRRRPQTRWWISSYTPRHRTAFMPTTGQAIERLTPTTPGSARWRGSSATASDQAPSAPPLTISTPSSANRSRVSSMRGAAIAQAECRSRGTHPRSPSPRSQVARRPQPTTRRRNRWRARQGIRGESHAAAASHRDRSRFDRSFSKNVE